MFAGRCKNAPYAIIRRSIGVAAGSRGKAVSALRLLSSLAVALILCGPAHALTFGEARHLLSRTGFGTPSAGNIKALMPLDHETAVERLLGGLRSTPATPPPPWVDERPLFPEALEALSDDQRRASRAQRIERGRKLKEWWFAEMLETDSPLTERLVLFWHNHFPSSVRYVRWPGYLYRQNALLRRRAAGNFAELLHEVAKDPAMLLYLDGQTNRAGNPNENFAREFLELFTLGEGQGYSERDIREAARAFTGWMVDPETGDFKFARAFHDGGTKTFMGRRGRFTGDDIIDIVLEHPRVAEHVTEKLWRAFVSYDPDPAEVRRLAQVFREAGYEVRPLLRGLLNSPQFRAAQTRGTLVKSPVDLIVGTLRFLGLRSDDMRWLVQIHRRLGLDILDPPNVGGWPGGSTWITSATLPARHAFLSDVSGEIKRMASVGAGMQGPARKRPDLLAALGLDSPDRMARVLLPLPPAKPAPAGEGSYGRLRRLLLDPAYQLM